MSNFQDEWEQTLEQVRKMTGGGVIDPANREAIALERIADTLDNIAALLASQRVPAGSSTYASGGGTTRSHQRSARVFHTAAGPFTPPEGVENVTIVIHDPQEGNAE